MSAIEDAMATLTAQYYNALTTALKLDPSQFQLAQGAISLRPDSSSIWRFFDSQPPASVNNYFQTSQLNSFSAAYSAVLNNLIPQSDNEQQTLLGDRYVDWAAYQKKTPLTVVDWTNSAQIAAAQLARFNQWAFNEADGLSTSAIEAMRSQLSQIDLIGTAMGMLNAAKAGGMAYTASSEGMIDSLNKGRPDSFTMNSATQDSTLNKKWAKAEMSGHYWFVSVGASSEWDKTVQDIAKSGVKAEVSFKKVATLLGGPYGLATPMSPDLTKFKPWFNGKALSTARAQNDNKLWKHSAPTWDSTFGPAGDMQRATTALIVVDGMQTKITSTASVAKSDQENFKAAAKVGVWPWFQAEGSGGWSNTTTFNDDGSFTITSGNPKEGNALVLGTLVTDIGAAFT